MAAVVLYRAIIARNRGQSAPTRNATTVIKPYHSADADPIMAAVRSTGNRSAPANAGTTARTPGTKRLTKTAAIPYR